jgi:hypothetical protein
MVNGLLDNLLFTFIVAKVIFIGYGFDYISSSSLFIQRIF